MAASQISRSKIALALASGALLCVVLAAAPAQAQFLQQGAKLVGNGAIGAAEQGGSVAASANGDTVLVGGEADNSNIGAAWVYIRSGVAWTQQAELVGSSNVGQSYQGLSVSLSSDGNTAIVGGNGDNDFYGAAWIFVRSGGTWTQQAKLIGIGGVGDPEQGTSVALSADGSTAIIGGPYDNSQTGAAWVFTRSGGTWTQQAELIGSGAAGNARQGVGVALSADGNTALVGGPLDNNATSETGAAWVFTRSNGVWTQQGNKLLGSNSVNGSFEGFAVALSADGNTAALGGYLDNTQAGAVWVFHPQQRHVGPAGQ